MSGYQKAFRREDDARTRDSEYVLRQVPIFRSLPGSALAALSETVHLRTFRRDEYVYYEGDPGLGLDCLIKQSRPHPRARHAVPLPGVHLFPPHPGRRAAPAAEGVL